MKVGIDSEIPSEIESRGSLAYEGCRKHLRTWDQHLRASGGGERLLTNAWQDEGASWAPNGQFVMFHRTTQGSGNATLYAVNINGGQPRRMPTPVGGSDPSWSPLNN